MPMPGMLVSSLTEIWQTHQICVERLLFSTEEHFQTKANPLSQWYEDCYHHIHLLKISTSYCSLVLASPCRPRLLTDTRESISPVLVSLHWLPVKYKTEFKVILFVFKATHGLEPLSELFYLYSMCFVVLCRNVWIVPIQDMVKLH